MNSSSPADCSPIRSLAEDLKGNKDIAQSLIRFEIADTQPENALCQLGLPHENAAVSRIAAALGKGSQYYNRALGEILDTRIADYENRVNRNHHQRRKELEDIIRLLNPVEKDADAKLLALLAKAYFYRGLLYRPKGRTVPARKIEAIKKAMALSERAIGLSHKPSLKTWAYAALELERADTSFKTPSDKLKKAALLISKDKAADLNDAIVILTYTERSNNDKKFLKNVNSFFKNVDLNEEKYQKNRADFFLLKAKFSFLSDSHETGNYLSNAINNAPQAFAAPFWDDLVDFLKKLRVSQCDLWKKMSLQAHSECQKREAKIQRNIYLRWYWSRQKELYDLAFLAADSPEKKAEIADSLKSRPVLRYQALNELRSSDPNINAFLEQEDEARDERYIKRNQNLKHIEKKLSEETEKKKVISLQSLPSPWVAIHFYLNELETRAGEKGGHALIFDSQKKVWKECLFDYRLLHQKFLSWQEAYLSSEKIGADSLAELCRTIGDTMPFLFDKDIIPEKNGSGLKAFIKKLTRPQKSRVLWIPHGFLHRLPLHAAICRKSNKVFLEDHISRYLPAWHMLKTETSGQSSGEYLLKDFPATFDFLERRKWNNPDYKTKPATPELLIDCMKNNPAVLTILCHGEGNILNPFKSKLKLGSGISVIDILKSDVVKISGTQVMLGACESDAAPPTEHTIDEHLSLSTVFLLHHAKEVTAGLWKVEVRAVDKCYHGILNKKDDVDVETALQEWQNKQLSEWKSEWKNKKDNLKFYLLAPFRVMGFPEISEAN